MYKKWVYPYLFWVSFFITLPLLLIFIYSISTSTESPLTFKLTFDNFAPVFTLSTLNVFVKSLVIGTLTTLVCLLLGFPVAYAISKAKKTTQSLILILCLLPMWTNMLMRTYAWIYILDKNGILNTVLERIFGTSIGILYTPFAVLLGMVYNFLPFMILPIYTSLIKIDENIIKAAYDLGASHRRVLIDIILPLVKSGIITGIIMVLLPALTNFSIPVLLGGSDYILIGNIIERQFITVGNWNGGAAYAITLILLISIALYGTRKETNEVNGGM